MIQKKIANCTECCITNGIFSVKLFFAAYSTSKNLCLITFSNQLFKVLMVNFKSTLNISARTEHFFRETTALPVSLMTQVDNCLIGSFFPSVFFFKKYLHKLRLSKNLKKYCAFLVLGLWKNTSQKKQIRTCLTLRSAIFELNLNIVCLPKLFEHPLFYKCLIGFFVH